MPTRIALSLAWTAITGVAILFVGITVAAGAKPVGKDLGRRIVQQGSAGGAPACVSCHGPKLLGNTAIGSPPIAGRPADYIVARLDHYAGPTGHNAMMRQVATALTPDERQAVAQYISTLKPAPVMPPMK
jgi:cytochrome c553